MIKKIIGLLTLLLVLTFPITVFADSANTTNFEATKVPNTPTTGNFTGTDYSSGDSLVTPQKAYWAKMTVKASVIGTSTVEADFNVTANDNIYSMYLTAELQRYDDGEWVTVDTNTEYFSVNPSSKTPEGQFNFYNIDVDGDYRVQIYGTMTARNTKFSLVTAPPTSNTVSVGGIIV